MSTSRPPVSAAAVAVLSTHSKTVMSYLLDGLDKYRYDVLMVNKSPIHPGEILLEDFMKPLGLSQYRLAKDLGVSPIRISQIVNGQRAISTDTALRLGRYFGTSAAVWLRLQVRYDLEAAEKELKARIDEEVKARPQFEGIS